MALKDHHWHLLPTWEDGSLKSGTPRGYLEGSSIILNYERQPSLWFLALDFYKVAKAQGWTKQEAQRELEKVIEAVISSHLPTATTSVAFHQATVRFAKRYRQWGVKLVFAVVVALIERGGSTVFKIDNSDRRTQIQQSIEQNIITNNFYAPNETEQERRIRAIVEEALRDAEAKAKADAREAPRRKSKAAIDDRGTGGK
jgi:hypothetical protein